MADDALTPKPVSASRVETTEIVLPSHTNQLGNIFGGQLMAWIDVTAAIAASRHARAVCVTASMDALQFLAPIKLGQHVTLLASVNFTGRTSMEVGVRIDSENPASGERTHVATSYLTFVAIDEHGVPREVPPILPETVAEKRRWEHARTRRAARLALKKQLFPSLKPPAE
jgi:acyl-CoA hydrolase